MGMKLKPRPVKYRVNSNGDIETLNPNQGGFNRQPGPVDFYGTIGTNIGNPDLRA